MKVSFRQGIVRHQTDGANNPLFLQASGSTVTLYVSPDPTIFTVTNGMAEYLYTEPTTVTSAWAGPFSPGSDYWLYWDLSLTTGLRTFGHTIFEPIEQSDAPSTPAVDQHWFNTTDRKMYVWQGNSWSERIRVFAAKYTNGTTFESMSIDAPIFTGTQVGLTMSHLSGGIAFDSNGQPIRNSNGTFFTTEDLFTAGVPEGSSLKINMIIVNAEAQEPLSAFQVVMLTDFNQIEHANPYLQGTSVFGILEEDAPTGESARMVTEGRLTNDQWDWEVAGAEANDFLYCDATGMLVLVPAIADQAPCAQILDKQTILFRPEVRTTTGTPTFSGSHGDLLDLGNDDHPQYHNDVRGDIRYYSRVELDPILTGKSDVGHTHVKVDILDFAHGHTIAEIATLQAVLDDKLSRQGDTMDASADLTFVGGEVLGLPAVPSSGDAAASKDYVDDQLSPLNAGTNITIDGSPNAINVEPQGVGSGLDADLWDGEQSNISSPANGEVMTYDSGAWINAVPAAAGISTVQEEGSPVAGSPHDTMNFVGSGVTATDGTGGVVTVTIPGGSSVGVQDEGGNLAATPHSTLNFVGTGVTAANAGSGVATITIAGGGTKIEDADGDTYVDVEPSADSDTIVMALGDGGDVYTAATVANFGRTSVDITALSTPTIGQYGADINITAGDGVTDFFSSIGGGGHVTITAGSSSGVTPDGGGNIILQTGNASNASGGNVQLIEYTGVQIISSFSHNAGHLHFMEAADNGANYIQMKAPAALAGSIIYTLPISPAAGLFLQTDAGGVLSWAAAGGGGGGAKIEDADGDTWVDVEASADSDEVEIRLGDNGDGFTAGKVAEFNRAGTFIRTLASAAGTSSDINVIAGAGYDGGGSVNITAGLPGDGASQHAAGGVNISTPDVSAYSVDGGDIAVTAGSDTHTNGYRGGAIAITSGSTNGYRPGNIDITAGSNTPPAFSSYNWQGGNITIQSGDGGWEGGDLTLNAGDGDYNRGGIVNIRGGDTANDGDGYYGGRVFIYGGSGGYYGGRILIAAGNAGEPGEFNTGADVYISAGVPSDTGGGIGGNARILAGGSGWDGRGDFEGGFALVHGGDAEPGYHCGEAILRGGVGGSVSNGWHATVQVIGETFTRNGGDVDIFSGESSYDGSSNGDVNITAAGSIGRAKVPGSIDIQSGSTRLAATPGGDITLQAGDTSDTTNDPLSVGGDITLIAGRGDLGAQAGGIISLETRLGTAADGHVQIRSQDALAPTLRFNDTDDSHYVGLKSPNAVTTSITYTLPVSPVANDVLQTDASGVTSWVTLQYIHTGASGTNFNVNHGLGQQWCTVQVYNSGTGVNIVPTSVTMTDANNCTVVLGAAAAVKIVVMGVPGVV